MNRRRAASRRRRIAGDRSLAASTARHARMRLARSRAMSVALFALAASAGCDDDGSSEPYRSMPQGAPPFDAITEPGPDPTALAPPAPAELTARPRVPKLVVGPPEDWTFTCKRARPKDHPCPERCPETWAEARKLTRWCRSHTWTASITECNEAFVIGDSGIDTGTSYIYAKSTGRLVGATSWAAMGGGFDFCVGAVPPRLTACVRQEELDCGPF